ncbi:MAG: glycosyltransferase family 2 protein [Bacteroidia bacterium]|nr:glycosyltransferase family 2 protein [Bacteroidia bacterium]
MSALIIPCYIKSQWDINCLYRLLESVQNQTRKFDKVYLVDDASPLKYELPYDFAEHILLNENGGPARARNTGIERALASGIEHLLFTDHDCIPEKDWNDQMTGFLEQTSFAAVGGMTYSWGNTIYDYYHNINGTLAGKWLLPDKKELWYMPSLNFGMKAFAAEEFPFDERFPTAAGEDVDLCLRLRSKYRIGFCPTATLWHDYGYKNAFTGFRKFVNLFKKYKSSSATVYEGHTVLMWDSSESIYKGNMYESNLQTKIQ